MPYQKITTYELLSSTNLCLLDCCHHSQSNGQILVTHDYTTKRCIVRKFLNDHQPRGKHFGQGKITRLDGVGAILDQLACTAIQLLQKLKFAINMGQP